MLTPPIFIIFAFVADAITPMLMPPHFAADATISLMPLYFRPLFHAII